MDATTREATDQERTQTEEAARPTPTTTARRNHAPRHAIRPDVRARFRAILEREMSKPVDLLRTPNRYARSEALPSASWGD